VVGVNVCDEYHPNRYDSLISSINAIMVKQLIVSALTAVQHNRVILVHFYHDTTHIAIGTRLHRSCAEEYYTRVAFLEVPHRLSFDHCLSNLLDKFSVCTNFHFFLDIRS
jgi:hypothetical protein